MLTPKDIHEVEFPRVLKGYSPREVDAFLRKIVVEYEGMLQENDDLQAQIRVLEEKVYEAAALQKGIRDALAKANELVERRRVEAEEEAERILQKARHQAQLEEEHMRRIQEFGAGVKRRLRSLLMTHIALMDEEDEPARPPRRAELSIAGHAPAERTDRRYRDDEYGREATSSGGHDEPGYDERDYDRDYDERDAAPDDEFERTRVFTLPAGMRDRVERDEGEEDDSDTGTALAVARNGYDEAAVAGEGDDDRHVGQYEEDDDGPYDEEHELEARWARRLRRNREMRAMGAAEDD